jgi:taurine--2-oxoglutarate transaminase
MDELVGACKAGGLLPFANFNRIHVVPPLNISVEDARAGLSIRDRALHAADRHVQG